MKFKLLTVFLAASGLLTSTRPAFGQSESWQKNVGKLEHLVCVKQAQQLLCNVETSGKRNQKEAPNPGAVKLDKATASLKSSSSVVMPHLLSSQEQKSLANIFLWLSYLLPSGLVLGIFLSDSYWAYRSAVVKRQIDLLERLWQSGSDNDATTDSERGANG